MRSLLAATAILLATMVPAPTTAPTPAATAPIGPGLTGRHVLVAGPDRLIEVVGELATAHRVAILVPGADTTVADFDRGHGGVQRRSLAWQARRLHEAAGGNANGVAVIAWLGYDPPDGIGLDAARSTLARDGARDLVAFTRWLAVARPEATVTVIGHSYGSVVMAHAAAALPPAVTDLVAIGSPGMDVDTAADLGTTARVHAASAVGDWTTRLPDVRLFGLGHGAHPTRPDFGAEPFDVTGAVGHDGYFVPGAASLTSLAAIIAGPGERVHTVTAA